MRRVLVATKYRFIGDTLLAVPLLRAAAALWPDAQITVMTGPAAQELLQGCPYVYDTICFDPYRKADEGFRRFFQIVRQVRRKRFDVALVCNRSFHGALIAKMGGIPQRVGWSGFQKRDFLLTRSVPYNNKAPEIQSYLDLLTPFAPEDFAPSQNKALQLWISDAERRQAADLLDSSGTWPLIGLQPGATHAEKRWPPAGYGELVRALLERYPQARFVLLGGPDETEYAANVLQQCSESQRNQIVSLVGKLSLRETLATLVDLDVFVGGDTAVRHAAMALSTMTVALFGPTSASKWGNAAPPHHIVLDASTRLVADITASEVAAAVASVLDKETAPTSRLSRNIGQSSLSYE